MFRLNAPNIASHYNGKFLKNNGNFIKILAFYAVATDETAIKQRIYLLNG